MLYKSRGSGCHGTFNGRRRVVPEIIHRQNRNVNEEEKGWNSRFLSSSHKWIAWHAKISYHFIQAVIHLQKGSFPKTDFIGMLDNLYIYTIVFVVQHVKKNTFFKYRGIIQMSWIVEMTLRKFVFLKTKLKIKLKLLRNLKNIKKKDPNLYSLINNDWF